MELLRVTSTYLQVNACKYTFYDFPNELLHITIVTVKWENKRKSKVFELNLVLTWVCIASNDVSQLF
jgi:hypothetical protein